MQPLVLGMSAFYHDSAACLLRGGRVVAAAQEERFTRRKFDNSFPEHAIAYCLAAADISPAQLDLVAFYEEPLLKLDRIVETRVRFAARHVLKNYRTIRAWVRSHLAVENMIYQGLPGYGGDVAYVHHHESHAASAFYVSPFERAALLTVDGVGEWACSGVGKGDDGGVRLLVEGHFPHSVGMLYSAVTQHLGFKVNSGEYKLMGLAPYGKRTFVRRLKDEIVQVNEDGSIVLNLECFDFMVGDRVTSERFSAAVGLPARAPESELRQEHMDLARSMQETLEEIVLKMGRHAVALTGYRDVCLAGGVALNCVANGRLLRSGIVDRVWVQPASGDAGGALGAALIATHEILNVPRQTYYNYDGQCASLLGPSYTTEQIQTVLESYGFRYDVAQSRESACQRIAELLDGGQVVGFFQGRMEYGPRALGARSILADARPPKMQRHLNKKIKSREGFRPFAPAVLEEKAGTWFDMSGPSPYMLFTFPVTEAVRLSDLPEDGAVGLDRLQTMRSRIQAVTHVDFSARVQTVCRETNPYFYGVLEAFEAITGLPVVINTSFNVRGEPIVCTPLDALRCFMNTEMDWLVLEHCFLDKRRQQAQLVVDGYVNQFEPD